MTVSHVIVSMLLRNGRKRSRSKKLRCRDPGDRYKNTILKHVNSVALYIATYRMNDYQRTPSEGRGEFLQDFYRMWNLDWGKCFILKFNKRLFHLERHIFGTVCYWRLNSCSMGFSFFLFFWLLICSAGKLKVWNKWLPDACDWFYNLCVCVRGLMKWRRFGLKLQIK